MESLYLKRVQFCFLNSKDEWSGSGLDVVREFYYSKPLYPYLLYWFGMNKLPMYLRWWTSNNWNSTLQYLKVHSYFNPQLLFHIQLVDMLGFRFRKKWWNYSQFALLLVIYMFLFIVKIVSTYATKLDNCLRWALALLKTRYSSDRVRYHKTVICGPKENGGFHCILLQKVHILFINSMLQAVLVLQILKNRNWEIGMLDAMVSSNLAWCPSNAHTTWNQQMNLKSGKKNYRQNTTNSLLKPILKPIFKGGRIVKGN
jgi:hypothetical protein